ncbi:MAG: aldo/keto reductase [Desulfovibrionaceae bacterium]|nr:aldo/keto reductase [Desulfovibrionaceae bacterium]
MPLVGLGTYALNHSKCVNAVMAFLKAGGRLIDTAHFYGNEDAVGEGVRRAMKEYGIPREDIFVTTKLYPNQYSDPEAAIAQAYGKLNIGFIDLLLLHHPGTDDVKTYKAAENAAADGRIGSIGLSNWYVRELKEFLPKISVMPVLVQNEIHPFYQEQEVVPYIQSLGIVVQGWYPFGGRGYTKDMLGNGTLEAIAAAHGVTAAQVILRWNLQRGVTVIPGSGNPDHIKENLDIFDFKLSDEEMKAISRLDRNEKHDWY